MNSSVAVTSHCHCSAPFAITVSVGCGVLVDMLVVVSVGADAQTENINGYSMSSLVRVCEPSGGLPLPFWCSQGSIRRSWCSGSRCSVPELRLSGMKLTISFLAHGKVPLSNSWTLRSPLTR